MNHFDRVVFFSSSVTYTCSSHAFFFVVGGGEVLGKDGDEQDWHNKEVLHFPPTLLMYEPQVEFILLLWLFCTLRWEMFPMVLQFSTRHVE